MSYVDTRSELQGYLDPHLNVWTIPVLPGEHKMVTSESNSKDVALQTLLGSCVSACIRDVRSGCGGLNHFLLPADKSQGITATSSRYGVQAMELLINSILKTGAQKTDLEAKVFGGANVLHNLSGTSVGDKNSAFVKEYLAAEGIPVTASDLGGAKARKIFFFPSNGRVLVQNLNSASEQSTFEQEQSYQKRIPVKPKTGGVDLF